MGTDAFQEGDIAAITHAVTKRTVVVRSVSEIVHSLRAAFRLARGPRPGPVLVDIPSDVLTAAVPLDQPFDIARDDGSISHHSNGTRYENAVSQRDIDATIEALGRAERPIIIVGGGARWARAANVYRETRQLCGATNAGTVVRVRAPQQRADFFRDGRGPSATLENSEGSTRQLCSRG